MIFSWLGLRPIPMCTIAKVGTLGFEPRLSVLRSRVLLTLRPLIRLTLSAGTPKDYCLTAPARGLAATMVLQAIARPLGVTQAHSVNQRQLDGL